MAFGFRFFAMLVLLLAVLAVASPLRLGVADHCETAQAHLHGTESAQESADEEHSHGCPIHHPCAVQVLTLPTKTNIISLPKTTSASLGVGQLLRVKTAPLLEGPFQPPRA